MFSFAIFSLLLLISMPVVGMNTQEKAITGAAFRAAFTKLKKTKIYQDWRGKEHAVLVYNLSSSGGRKTPEQKDLCTSLLAICKQKSMSNPEPVKIGSGIWLAKILRGHQYTLYIAQSEKPGKRGRRRRPKT